MIYQMQDTEATVCREDGFVELARVNHAHSTKNPYLQSKREHTTDVNKRVGVAPIIFTE